MSRIYLIGGKFPWFHRLPELEAKANDSPIKEWVKLPDGRIGVVDHEKPDGMIAVRPVDSHGNFYRNTSEHWTHEQRLSIPEEVIVSRDDVFVTDDIPAIYKVK